MNILVDKLPTDYKGLKINTNFRSFILFELLMQDNTIEKDDKVALMINLFYQEIPTDLKKAVDGIIWFYSCGNEKKDKLEEKSRNDKKKKIYSYEYDANLIYAAFLDQYGIDLNDADYLHWFKFRSMFEALKSDNKICEIMGYRAIDISKIKDKNQKQKYKKLQKEFALPDERTEEEKEQDFANALW